jgi:CheY-like chemotaxis protein
MEDVESLVSSLVDISKLDAGVVKPDIAPVCVDNLLLNLANEFSSQAGAQSLRFRFTTSTAVISTDCQLLARILRNLLSNAIRYTDNGDILLGCRRRQEGLQIEVWDTGVGIPQEKLTEIFLEFKQLPSDKSRGAKGLGLGLSIVDKISRVLGNQISVRSSVGKGSVFSILVPYGQLDEPEIIHSPPPLVQLQNPVEGKRLLVIDNDTSICAGMETPLSSWNCQVQTETSIHHLDSDQLKDNPPDLVIVDYHLDNGETGIEAAVLLKQWLGETLPILMITANRTQDLKKQVRELELQLLNKPIKPHKLKSMLRFMLG